MNPSLSRMRRGTVSGAAFIGLLKWWPWYVSLGVFIVSAVLMAIGVFPQVMAALISASAFGMARAATYHWKVRSPRLYGTRPRSPAKDGKQVLLGATIGVSLALILVAANILLR